MFASKFSTGILLLLTVNTFKFAYADTMEHYMRIVNNIPKMEIKADVQAQMWAKSAHNILLLTCESVAESLTVANEAARRQNAPLFCMPPTVTLSGALVQTMLPHAYHDMMGQTADKANMTVSEVTLLALTQTYPCSTPKTVIQPPPIRMQSVSK
jgi:hypothetical protein